MNTPNVLIKWSLYTHTWLLNLRPTSEVSSSEWWVQKYTAMSEKDTYKTIGARVKNFLVPVNNSPASICSQWVSLLLFPWSCVSNGAPFTWCNSIYIAYNNNKMISCVILSAYLLPFKGRHFPKKTFLHKKFSKILILHI